MTAPVSTAAEAAPACENVQATFDVEGDGRADLFGVSCAVRNRQLRVMRGVDGTLLWSRTLGDSASVRAARVGASASPGFIATWVRQERLPGPHAVQRLTATVLALGADGTEVWSREISGLATGASFASAVIGKSEITAGVLNAVTGPADDVVITVSNVAVAGVSSAQQTVVEVLDGTTGAVIPVTGEADAESTTRVLAAPDVSADGLDDMAVLGLKFGDDSLAMHQGSAGPPIWTTDGLTLDRNTVLRDLGDLTGDARSELLLVPEAFDREGGRATLLDGASGTLLWERRLEGVLPVGDADGDGVRDIGLLIPELADSSFLQFEVVKASGSAIRRFAAGDVAAAGGSYIYPYARSAGDVDDDGLADLLVDQLEYNGSSLTERHVVQSGRDGHVVWSQLGGVQGSADGVRALAFSVDGEGDDVLATKAHEGGIRLRALDGATAATLWSSDVAGATAAPRVVDTADVDGDDTPDLVLEVPHDDHARTVVISGRKGSVLW